jgi:hypothetical protein
MLKPLAARIPETRERTPGSFWTRQLRTWRFGGAEDGSGVSYRIEETAAEADQASVSDVGRGFTRRWRALYASAEVDEELEGRQRCGVRVRDIVWLRAKQDARRAAMLQPIDL